jgi:hypothetical protein
MKEQGMDKEGWPKPTTWLRPIEDAEYAELTAEEERILEEAGLDMTPLPEDGRDPLEEGRRLFLELVTSGSFSVAEVAYNLNRPQATISSWIDDRRLFAIWHEGRWRVPKFQFSEDGRELIPGIEEVNMRIPIDSYPLGIERWYRMGDADINGEDQSLSPLEWLRSGRDLETVVESAEMLQYPCFQ